MASNYFRTPQMQTGKGFRCPNCNKSLAVKVKAPTEIAFHCSRCKSYIYLKMQEPAPWTNPALKQSNDATTQKVAELK